MSISFQPGVGQILQLEEYFKGSLDDNNDSTDNSTNIANNSENPLRLNLQNGPEYFNSQLKTLIRQMLKEHRIDMKRPNLPNGDLNLFLELGNETKSV
jgi:hypothetical protein